LAKVCFLITKFFPKFADNIHTFLGQALLDKESEAYNEQFK
tara:strand:+ start:495 stop:617 length:123 start_codon:yes stop_codon:yes gene_type:complete